MPRARLGSTRARRKSRVLKMAKGYVGGRHRLFRTAQESVYRAQASAFRDRKRRKRDFRRLWITRISAAARQRGMSYSHLMYGLVKAGVALNRKIMADVAVNDAASFDELVVLARQAFPQAAATS